MGKISWEHFATSDCDIDGIRMKFEALCRQLFVNEFLSKNIIQRTVHCNPNNPGIESEPVFDEQSQRRIGYQVKFFDNGVDYNQIKHSAQKTVEYYSGKIDHIYLFCNKAIKASTQSFFDIEKILSDAGISIELITDTMILDLVRKYPNLGLYYFEQHFLTQEWFEAHMQEVQQKLGERYNSVFNVDTSTSMQLSLFLQDEEAVVYLNAKKNIIIDKLNGLGWQFDQYRTYLNKIDEVVSNIDDVDIETLMDASQWNAILFENIQDELVAIYDELKDLEDERITLNEIIYSVEENNVEKIFKEKKKIETVRNKIKILKTLIEIPQILKLSEAEIELLNNKILFVEGRAGVGKSHLFASKAVSLLNEKRYALLLLGGDYLDNSAIQQQIISNLNVNFSFEELIDILDSWGRENKRKVPILIDALNETWNHSLWKNGLPAIIRKVEETEYVRLGVSFRIEYRSILIGNVSDEGICIIEHQGFNENSLDAVRQFMNHYGISFSPIHLFNSEITNPLFLTLYCKTYQGDEVDLPTLYDRVLRKANDNLYVALPNYLEHQGYYPTDDLVIPIIKSIADFILHSGKKFFSKEELTGLSVWKEYGLNPRTITQQLIQENILHNYLHDDSEVIYFAYDQMNDYFCAKAILSKYNEEEDLRSYLINDVLGINNGEVTKFNNIDLFIASCALYAEKYEKECIDVIELIENNFDQASIFADYVSSLQWRKKICFSIDELIDGCKKYSISPEIVWEMLIANSVKLCNPFNANALHDILMKYPLNKRDQIWTTYINGLENNHENRLAGLIKMYNSGEKLNFTDNHQTTLLLTLFSWCLTSSDRWLRDVTAKAMVEILKNDFSLCEQLLKKFQSVNDPYVIQRLYGVVFGAAVKRVGEYKEEYKSLAKFAYDNIFDCDNVYPDILLRDYARLLIERFIYEFPEEKGNFIYEKIVPPYQSEKILAIDDQGYLTEDFSSGTYRIMSSMKFEGMGMYGDFGRYVFQSALSNFDVDQKKIFNYAIHYILNELKYDEEMLGSYDSMVGHYDYNRHNVAKIERIGKKYQWIAMHNIMARVSDHFIMRDPYDFEKKEIFFEGAWEPFIRDFDPTLNSNAMICPDAPIFKVVKDNIDVARQENAESIPSSSTDELVWINKETVFFDLQKRDLILTDDHGVQWVVLSKYADTGNKNLAVDRLLNWNWLYGYFVTEEQKRALCQNAGTKEDFLTNDVAWIPETYTVFCREYPWSPGCKGINENIWVDFEIRTGEKRYITETLEVADFEKMNFLPYNYLQSNENDSGIVEKTSEEETVIVDEVFSLPLKLQTFTREEDVTKQIGKILHTTVDLMWETGYDASKEETISYGVPCAPIIEEMQLTQLFYDGFFYDENGILSAFDTELSQQKAGVVIRKDILDSFLKKMNLCLIWFVNGAKEIHDESTSIVAASSWKGLYIYEGKSIEGEVYKTNAEQYRGK